METLNDWIKAGKPYDAGIGLLAKLSRNRVLLQNLSRKENPGKLEYELRKVSKGQPSPLPPKPVTRIPTIPPVPTPKPVQKKSEVDQPHIDLAPVMTGRLRIVRGTREIDYQDLPERLRKVYDDTMQLYRVMRVTHEKAKLAKTDKERAELTDQLVKMDESVRKHWAELDAWDGQADVKTGNIDHHRINANRKHLSKNKKVIPLMSPGPKRDELLRQMQARVDELLAAGENLERSRKDLEAIGLKIKK